MLKNTDLNAVRIWVFLHQVGCHFVKILSEIWFYPDAFGIVELQFKPSANLAGQHEFV